MVRVFETEEDGKSDGKSCSVIREDLKHCILSTDCVRIVESEDSARMSSRKRSTPRECLRERDPSVPEECFQLTHLLFECKRSLIDFRTRFRGRKGYSGIEY
ncbi:unnamed protein product [Medioppia subpectinata]|uniref:Cytochrome c oxidase assembly factor 5 n=1 Tax=Medioppia subpectinata TaxID=1979941 RepID=A0A7R9KJH6_9ACAR|nr:unnamed protein product [Medioppia subpectinata]CAG2103523.1 unnamed protein product [Medioppia subpectinata]